MWYRYGDGARGGLRAIDADLAAKLIAPSGMWARWRTGASRKRLVELVVTTLPCDAGYGIGVDDPRAGVRAQAEETRRRADDAKSELERLGVGIAQLAPFLDLEKIYVALPELLDAVGAPGHRLFWEGHTLEGPHADDHLRIHTASEVREIWSALEPKLDASIDVASSERLAEIFPGIDGESDASWALPPAIASAPEHTRATLRTPAPSTAVGRFYARVLSASFAYVADAAKRDRAILAHGG